MLGRNGKQFAILHGGNSIHGVFILFIDYANGLCVGGIVLSEYLLSLIGVVLLSAILTGILPEGKTSGLIKSVMRMVCILAIISPILTFFTSGRWAMTGEKNSMAIFTETGIQQDDSFIHYYSEMRVTETEKALKQELLERFSVQTNVELIWEMKKEEVGKNASIEVVKITQICVEMIGEQNEEVVGSMWEYLTKSYCSEVLIE